MGKHVEPAFYFIMFYLPPYFYSLQDWNIAVDPSY